MARIGGRVEQHARQRAAVEVGLRRQPDEVEHGRHQVDARDLRARAPAIAPGRAHDQRHVRGGVVDEERMGRLAVLAEALAVVGGDDQQRAFEQRRAAQPVDQAAHHGVGVLDLAQVRLAGVARGVGFGRLVGRMRIVEMHPGEEFLRAHAGEPGQRFVHHGVAAFLDAARRFDLLATEVEAVGIDVEALVEAPARVEHPGSDEGPRRVARLVQTFGQRRLRGVEEEATVVVHAVPRWVAAGEDRGMRREGQGHRGRGLFEQHAFARQRVQVRRGHAIEPIAAQPIGAQRVERHDDHVDVARRRRALCQASPRGRVVAGRPTAREVPRAGQRHGHADQHERAPRATAARRRRCERARTRRGRTLTAVLASHAADASPVSPPMHLPRRGRVPREIARHDPSRWIEPTNWIDWRRRSMDSTV